MKETKYTPELLKRVQNTELGILKDFIRVADAHEIDWFLVFGSALGAVRHQGFIPWDDDIDVAILRKDYKKFLNAFKEELADQYSFTNAERTEGFSSSVNHIELKNSRFVSADGLDFGHYPGIYIDVFVYDHQAPGKIRGMVQYGKGWVLGRLLFLCGTGSPYIPLKGFAGKAAGIICRCVHRLLSIMHIKPQMIYRMMERNAQKYNHRKTRQITAFEPPKTWLNTMTKNELYPLKKIQFEDIEAYVPNRVDLHLARLFGDYMQMPPEEKRWNHRPAIIEFPDGESD